MDRGNTKQEILDVALELFSRQGYEATSISSIADAVGIRKASLYSHFSSKQVILDEIVKIVLEKYDSHSFVLKKGMDNMPKNCDEAVAMIKGKIHYIANDPLISKARKMLTIEQFRNAELSKLLTKQNYTDIMNFFTAMVQSLIEAGVLVKGDREAMAASLCLPVSAWLNVLDRDGEKEDEILMLIDRHVREFFRIYGI